MFKAHKVEVYQMTRKVYYPMFGWSLQKWSDRLQKYVHMKWEV